MEKLKKAIDGYNKDVQAKIGVTLIVASKPTRSYMPRIFSHIQ